MNALFQDHAVLQRDRPIEVWGQAAAGETITVSLDNASGSAQANAAGQWSVTLPARGPGGPFVLKARGSSGNEQAAQDVLVGDVFLCSGQSNMELPVRRSGDTDAEIRNSTNDRIRMLTVQHAASPAARTDFQNPVQWQSAAPGTVPEWSATCFYFARELQKSVPVPIGLVHSSWGGSNIRPWLSAAALREAHYGAGIDLLSLYAKDPRAAQAAFGQQWEQWWRDKTGQKPGTEPWSAGDRSSWTRTPPQVGDWRYWGVPALRDFKGEVWFRAHIRLTAAQARSATRLDLGAINMVDETWLNGQVVGNTFGYDADRTYDITPGLLHAGDNLLVVNTMSNYGSRGMLNSGSRRQLEFSDGTSLPLDGAWQYQVVQESVGYPPRTPWEAVGGLSTLYNGMIAPLGRFGFRAALWYQGESNTGEWQGYQALLTDLMADWRRQFGAGLPFLVVQLPNYGPQTSTPVESEWAGLREAQKEAVAHDAHAGLAVTIDIGDPYNLHPTNKQEVGRRLARAARHVVYGEAITPSGPVAVSATRLGDKVVIDFRDVDGTLVAYSHDSPIGFELCGEGPGTCKFADARLDGAKVKLSGAGGAWARRVRYCWADSPVCTLFDGARLPAGPFELAIGGTPAQ
jgi:sialate O-acetylesterase